MSPSRLNNRSRLENDSVRLRKAGRENIKSKLVEIVEQGDSTAGCLITKSTDGEALKRSNESPRKVQKSSLGKEPSNQNLQWSNRREMEANRLK